MASTYKTREKYRNALLHAYRSYGNGVQLKWAEFYKEYNINKGLRSCLRDVGVLGVDAHGREVWYGDVPDMKLVDRVLKIAREKIKESEGRKKVEMSDAQMIKHLKSKGYKIMKPVQEWVEL